MLPLNAGMADDVVSGAKDGDICFRCTDRLRWRCWRLGTKMGIRRALRSSVRTWEIGVEFEHLPEDDDGDGGFDGKDLGESCMR